MATATARWFVLFLSMSAAAAAAHEKQWKAGGGQVVQKEKRRMVEESEAGTVTAADVADAAGTAYQLQFITMDPGALFLPVQLHADMVFYVHSGEYHATTIGKCTCSYVTNFNAVISGGRSGQGDFAGRRGE